MDVNLQTVCCFHLNCFCHFVYLILSRPYLRNLSAITWIWLQNYNRFNAAFSPETLFFKLNPSCSYSTNRCQTVCLLCWQGQHRYNTIILPLVLSWSLENKHTWHPPVVKPYKHMRGKEKRQTMKKIYIGKTALKVPRNGGKHPKKR